MMHSQRLRTRTATRYQIVASEACEPLARRIEEVRDGIDQAVIDAWNAQHLQFANYFRRILTDSNFIRPHGDGFPTELVSGDGPTRLVL